MDRDAKQVKVTSAKTLQQKKCFLSRFKRNFRTENILPHRPAAGMVSVTYNPPGTRRRPQHPHRRCASCLRKLIWLSREVKLIKALDGTQLWHNLCATRAGPPSCTALRVSDTRVRLNVEEMGKLKILHSRQMQLKHVTCSKSCTLWYPARNKSNGAAASAAQKIAILQRVCRANVKLSGFELFLRAETSQMKLLFLPLRV